jgi:hypothetical protein
VGYQKEQVSTPRTDPGELRARHDPLQFVGFCCV